MFKLKIILSNFLFVLSCFPAWLRFHLHKNNFQNIQNERLLKLLNKNKNTVYGEKYNFGEIKSISDFRKNIPLTDYEDYSEFIEQIKSGQNNILTSEKIKMLEPTSGSSGAKKYIPYNKGLKAEFQAGIEVWLFDLYINFPKLFLYKSYWSISPKTKTEENSNMKIGFDEDEEYLSKFARKILKNIIVKPDITGHFLENTKKIMTEEKDNLGLISVWSPTFIQTIFAENIPPFKNLQILSCWADSTSKIYAKNLNKFFQNTFIQPKGLLSTEGIVTFPFKKDKNVLSYFSHFYEFKDEQGKIFLSEELEKDKIYTVIITTSGGLYRYNTHDLVCVRKFEGRLPVFEFMGRDNNVSDYFGEKLSESFLKNVLDKLFGEYNFALFKFENGGYVLFTDKDCDISAKERELENLLEESYYYKNCIELKQLKPAEIRIMKDGLKRYTEHCQNLGMKLGDIKMKCLDNNFK